MTTINSPLDSPIIPRFLFALAGGVFLSMLGAIFIVGGFQYSYNDRIYPGVSVAGIDVSGLTREEAAEKITIDTKFPVEGRIALKDNDTVWMAAPIELGMYIDGPANADAAFNIGRTSDPGYAFRTQFGYATVDLPPLFVYDERAALAYILELSESIDVPTIEATLGLEGIEIGVRSGQIGRELDIPSVL
jgi:hypothetical protein